MEISPSVCKRLAAVNKDYRYGVAYLPGQGQIAFLAILVDRRHAGGDNAENRHLLVTHVSDLGDRLVKFYDKDGNHPCKVPADKAPVIISWPGQVKSFGNAAIVNGDHALFLENGSKPQYVIDEERKEAARENGKDMDAYVSGAAEDLADRWISLGAKETGRDKVFDREDTKAAWNSRQGQEIARIHDRAKEGSFEEFTLEENGFKR